MMVETMLESSADFGMSGALPQWKRELLQRRAARTRPAPPAPPPPPPSRVDDEELRYGPGIVKRLKSRYLSLALRDAPRRRPSVLRRAASLEHLLDERPPPAPRPAARAPRPASLAAPAAAQALRRESVKRARSVDALSRLEPRDEPPPSPPPPPRPAARPPRRPAPLLRDTERPPPDLVKSTLRKFEPAPVRRAAPAARVSAALRGLELRGAPEPGPPEQDPAVPSPAAAPPAEPRDCDETEGAAVSATRVVSRAALEEIARAGSTTRYAFPAPRPGSHLPPLCASNAVLLGRARRVGVIRPMPAPARERALLAPGAAAEEIVDKLAEEPAAAEEGPRSPPPPASPPPASPPPAPPSPEPAPRAEKRSPPPAALVEPIPRSPPPAPDREPTPERPLVKPDLDSKPPAQRKLVNGCPESPRAADRALPPRPAPAPEPRPGVALRPRTEPREPPRRRAPPPQATSVVFNFSHRKEVPDYIENDGLVLRASRRDRIKAGEPGVVVLVPELVLRAEREVGEGEGGEEGDGGDSGPPSPCDVRFVNDNVLINGRSSMPARRDRDRVAKLKLQFDDSLTRTFEYPSETSLCLDDSDAADAPPPQASLAANTHISRAALCSYTPHKTRADAFQLGVARRPPAPPAHEPAENGACAEGDARPCGADLARCWSDARALRPDLLF